MHQDQIKTAWQRLNILDQMTIEHEPSKKVIVSFYANEHSKKPTIVLVVENGTAKAERSAIVPIIGWRDGVNAYQRAEEFCFIHGLSDR